MRIIENGKSQIWSEYKISIQQSIIGTWNIVPYNFVAFKSVVNTFIELILTLQHANLSAICNIELLDFLSFIEKWCQYSKRGVNKQNTAAR